MKQQEFFSRWEHRKKKDGLHGPFQPKEYNSMILKFKVTHKIRPILVSYAREDQTLKID